MLGQNIVNHGQDMVGTIWIIFSRIGRRFRTCIAWWGTRTGWPRPLWILKVRQVFQWKFYSLLICIYIRVSKNVNFLKSLKSALKSISFSISRTSSTFSRLLPCSLIRIKIRTRVEWGGKGLKVEDNRDMLKEMDFKEGTKRKRRVLLSVQISYVTQR